MGICGLNVNKETVKIYYRNILVHSQLRPVRSVSSILQQGPQFVLTNQNYFLQIKAMRIKQNAKSYAKKEKKSAANIANFLFEVYRKYLFHIVFR